MHSAEEVIRQRDKCLGVLVILTYKCNFCCKTCADPLTNKPNKINQVLKVTDFVDFMSFLSRANDEFADDEPHFEWVSFTGGEVTTLPFEYIKQLCDIAHSYGFNTSMFTNGSAEERLLELDGYLNQMVISHHGAQAVMPKWASSFKNSAIVINKLMDKESFPTFEAFDNFVEEIIKANVNYRQRFSTYGYHTPEFKKHYPEWVNTAFANEQTFTKYSKRIIYKGMEVKFSEFSCMISRTFIQHPNGNINTTWENDLEDLNYRDLSECYLIRGKLEELNENFKEIVLNSILQ